MYPLKQSTALDILIFAHDANGDGVTGIVDGSWTKRISKAGAAFAAMTVTITERENGWYQLTLSSSHTDTLGILTCSFSAAGVKRVNVQFRVHVRVYDDFAFPASAGQSLAVNGSGQVTAASVASGGITAASFAAGAIDAAAIATDAIGSAELAASAVTEIAGGIWDEARASHTVAGSFGRALQILRDGTAQAGAGGSITLDAGASATDNFYNGSLIVLEAGTGVGQARFINGYTGASKVATVQGNWLTAPDNTTVFGIYPFSTIPAIAQVTGSVGSVAAGGITAAAFAAGAIDANAIATDAIGSAELAATAVTEIAAGVWDEARASHVAAGSFGQGVASVQGNVTGSVGSVASGGITTASFAAGAIDANAIATDAIGSAELAATAVTEIAAGVWDESRSAHTASGSFGASNQVIRGATAQAGAATTITLDASASATDSFYNEQIVMLIAGTGAGQARRITAYTGATKVATVELAWVTNPDNTSVFVITPQRTVASGGLSAGQVSAAVWDEPRASHTTAGTFGQGVASVQGSVTGSTASIAAGGITAATFAAGAIDAAAIATDAIGSAEIAASAITEIAGGVWDEARSGHVGAGTFGQGVASVQGNVTGSTASIAAAGITAASFAAGAIDANAIATDAIGSAEIATSAVTEIAGQVWEEARASHTTAGSFGQGVASVQGNVTGSVGSVTATVTATVGTGGITAASFAAGAIDAAAIATDAIGSAELAASATTEIADAVWNTTRAGHSTAGTFGEGVLVQSLNATAKADVNTEVLDVLTVDTFAEPSGAPGSTSTLKDKLNWVFALCKNRVNQTATLQTLRNAGDTANIATAAVSDDGTTAVRQGWV